MNTLRFAWVICSTGLVVGCATVEDQMAKYSNLSCSQLDQQIGKHKHLRKQAKIDGVVSGVVVAIGDKKASDDAALDNVVADISKNNAERDLDALRRVKRSKGCIG